MRDRTYDPLWVTVGFQTLLELHVIGDRLHSSDGARHPYCALDIGAGAHEAAQLNDALESLDFDLGDLEAGLIEDGRLDLARDDAVIDVLAGPLMMACGRAPESGHQQQYGEERSESFDSLHTMLQVDAKLGM